MMTATRNSKTNRIRATDTGTYIFPLSSEEPYKRSDGMEILDHSPSSVDLSFIASGNAPLLDSHIRYDGLKAQIGVVKDAWLEDKRLYVEVKFSNRSEAQAYRRDVEDGIITNVSVGYDIHEYERDEDADEYRVIKWTPKEASFVSIPADETVGMGRSAIQEVKMTKANTNPSSEQGVSGIMPGVTMSNEERAGDMETTITEISTLASEHNMGDIGRAFIESEVRAGHSPSIEVFKGIVRAKLPENVPLRNENIGLTDNETRKFSVVALAGAMREGANSTDRERAAFEIEACDAAAAVAGNTRGNWHLPAELMQSWNDFEIDGERSITRAALSVGGNPNVQSTDHLASRFIDNLRNRMVLGQLGITFLPGLSGNVDIPGGNANISAAWLGSEDADAAESNPSFRKVSLSIKDIATFTDLTRRMLIQTTIGIEQYVRNQIIDGIAQGIDLAGFYGSGSSGNPTGVANTTGIGTTTFAAAVPTRAELIDMDTAIANTNRMGDTVFVGNTAMAGSLRKTLVDAGSGVFLMSNSNTLEIGNTFERTNQITSGDVFAGIWSDLLLGMWGSLELDRSTEAKFLSGGIRLRAIQSVDFGVSRVGSFVFSNDGV